MMNNSDQVPLNVCAVLPLYGLRSDACDNIIRFDHGVTLVRADEITLEAMNKHMGGEEYSDWCHIYGWNLESIEWLLVLESTHTSKVKRCVVSLDTDTAVKKSESYCVDETVIDPVLFCLSAFTSKRILAPYVVFAEIDLGYDSFKMSRAIEGETRLYEPIEDDIAYTREMYKEHGHNWSWEVPMRDLEAAPCVFSENYDIIVRSLQKVLKDQPLRTTPSILENCIMLFARCDKSSDSEKAFMGFVSVLENFATGQSRKGQNSKKIKERIPKILGSHPEDLPLVDKQLENIYADRSTVAHGQHFVVPAKGHMAVVPEKRGIARDVAAKLLIRVLLNENLRKVYSGTAPRVQEDLDKRWPIELGPPPA